MKMLLTSILLPVIFGFASSEIVARRLYKNESIWGYYPENNLKDYLELDLDKASMEVELRIGGESNFHSAEELYKRGGFSSSYAILELREITGLASAIKKGTSVFGSNEQGREVKGEIMKDLSIGEMFIPVLYRYPPFDRNTTFTCVAGSLSTIGVQVTTGCFNPEGSISIEFISGRDTYGYKYNLLEDNRNAMTLQTLSANAEAEMLVCDDSCPHTMFKKYFEYYKVADYGDRWVTAAFSLSSTRLFRGNADFSIYSNSKMAQSEAAKLGVTCLNLWMYFIHKLNVAVKACDNGKIDVASWEHALALYTGSLERNKDKTSDFSNRKGTGRMLHAMADSLCIKFKTCKGEDGTSGPSMVSSAIFQHFGHGKQHLKAKECAAADEVKNLMEGVMVIPLLQGLQFHTYQQSHYLIGKNITVAQREEGEAKSAAYAAAILPLLHACSPKDAEKLHDILKVGSSYSFDSTMFGLVKTTLERHYSCMGVTCQDVGVLYNPLNKKYFEGVAPCLEGTKNKEELYLGGTVIGVFLLFILTCCICKRENEQFRNMCFQCWFGKRRKNQEREHDQVPLTYITNKWIV